MARPDDVRYSESHEWLRVDGAEGVVGITDYAVEQLKDLVHIEMPKVGQDLETGQPFGEIESVKTVSDLIAPVNGQVSAINQEITDDTLSLLNEDPYGKGWLVRVKLANPDETKSLMSAREYGDFLKSSEGHDH